MILHLYMSGDAVSVAASDISRASVEGGSTMVRFISANTPIQVSESPEEVERMKRAELKTGAAALFEDPDESIGLIKPKIGG